MAYDSVEAGDVYKIVDTKMTNTVETSTFNHEASSQPASKSSLSIGGLKRSGIGNIPIDEVGDGAVTKVKAESKNPGMYHV